MEELPLGAVRITGGFWGQRLAVNARRAIFQQWEQLEASGCIDNFRIAAGELDGLREGWFFADSDAFKWLDAAARIIVHHPDPRLAALMDDLIALLGRAQAPDGYLFTYNQVHFPGVRWANLQIEHELYCHGHLIEAGVSHHEATGRTELLAIARAAADRIVADFRGRGPVYTPGHEEIEIALLRLHRATGDATYRDLAQQFIEQRGRTPIFALAIVRQRAAAAARAQIVAQRRQAYLAAHPDYTPNQLPPDNAAPEPANANLRWYASALSGKYFQQHAPVRRQTIPVGHAVRFGYLQTAVAMLYRCAGDATLLPAQAAAWERMVSRRMYVTGGLGALPRLEGFGRDAELDPEFAYAETCAALAGLLWNWELALITGEVRYSDLFEWQLYNAAAVGMGLDGGSYLYNNPLACRGAVTRQAWYAVPCCPSNLSRTWAALGRYLYSRAGDDLWLHQYVTGQADVGGGLAVEVESGLPWDGQVRIRVRVDGTARRILRLRIPSWAGALAATLNGEPAAPEASQGAVIPGASGLAPQQARWWAIERAWRDGDEVALDFALPIRLLRQDRRLPRCGGMLAVARGPLVYCLESVDNPGVDLFDVEVDPVSLCPVPAPDLLGGATLLRGATPSGVPLTFIPYMLWANRGPSQMNVFVRSA